MSETFFNAINAVQNEIVRDQNMINQANEALEEAHRRIAANESIVASATKRIADNEDAIRLLKGAFDPS